MKVTESDMSLSDGEKRLAARMQSPSRRISGQKSVCEGPKVRETGYEKGNPKRAGTNGRKTVTGQ